MSTERPELMSRARYAGPALIAVAALLWATDTPFRFTLLRRLDPAWIVLLEHLLGLLPVAAWAAWRLGRRELAMRWPDLLLALLVGGGGSAAASVLFTTSFGLLNASVVILLQKLQPVFVILFARIFLGEKPRSPYYGWAALALVAAMVLAMSDGGAQPRQAFVQLGIPGGNPSNHLSAIQSSASLLVHAVLGLDPGSRGVFCALGAALLWSIATVAGKVLVRRYPGPVVTLWRYALGFGAMAAYVAILRPPGVGGSPLRLEDSLLPLLYVSWIPGLLAMLTYYAGLTRAPASVATVVELVYPVSAVLINLWVLHQPLLGTELGAGLVLLFAVSRISAA